MSKNSFRHRPGPSTGRFETITNTTYARRAPITGETVGLRWKALRLPAKGTDQEVWSLAFEIDASVTSFEIMVPDGSAEGQRFPVDVADTVLATDIE